ncbi:MAG: hypothetical protein ACOCW6_05670 [Spirochaetota bacterium]
MNRKRSLAILMITAVLLTAPAALFAFETFDSYPGFSYDIGASDNFLGLDTSMQAGSRFDLGPRANLDYHGGAGYRFTSIGDHAPFAEAGAGYRAGGLQIGANAKYILYDVVGEDRGHAFP